MRDDRKRHQPANTESEPFRFGSCLTLTLALIIIAIIVYWFLTH